MTLNIDLDVRKLLAMTTEAEFLTAYEQIRNASKNVMQQIDKAIAHEENERPLQAIVAYENCIRSINEVFDIPVGLPENIDAVEPEWLDACMIIQKMKGAKTELCYRLKVLRSQNASVDEAAQEATELDGNSAGGDVAESQPKKKSVLLESPATHFDINAGDTTKTYREIIGELRKVIATKDSGALFDTLFHSQAKLYKIQPNGVVSTMMGETSMSLVMCTVGNQWKFLNGSFFIQCTMAESAGADASAPSMIWIYPLIPTVTNCYRTEYGAFILPDLESDMPGTAFGLMILDPSAAESEEQLSDLQQFFLDLLEAVLSGTVAELKQPPLQRAPRDTSEQVSRRIVIAADFIARNLVKGAEKTGELMIKTTPYIISKMQPAPANAPPVSSKVQTSVEVAKGVSNVAVGVTGWVAGKVTSASMALGRYMAPHIQSSGAVLLEKGFGYNANEANSTMESAMTIAAGAVEGVSTVYNGLEESAKILGNNLSENSVKIIEHKYGPSAGNVASGTFDTIGNAFNVSQNVNYITPKGFAKKMAKNAGKAVVDDYKRNLRQESHIISAGALYPDLRTFKEKQS